MGKLCNQLGLNASISIFGSSFIILTYLCIKSLRSPTSKLVAWLAFADLMVSIERLVQSILMLRNVPACDILAPIEYFLYIQILLWTACIAHNILFTMERTKTDYEWIYVPICWLVPFGLTLALGLRNQFGVIPAAGGGIFSNTCWISKPFDIWDYIFVDVFITVIFLFNALCFFLLVRKLYALKAPDVLIKAVVKSTLGYLLVFFVVWSPILIASLCAVFDSNPNSFCLITVPWASCFLVSLQGIIFSSLNFTPSFSS
eukprot:TRINITY_DN3547_c0_g1_i2.p1 TRINITY_DN3547_c0_g1~~TRINITY_DN3547_c0_g1_i2.p1  ORF type:complete len:259 (-),score=9.90 TRINITY_DN3547_c0_g1_i2:162-938(-)